MSGVCGICHGGPWDGFTVADAVLVIRLEDGWYRWIDDRWCWRPLDDGETAGIVPLRQNHKSIPR